MKNKSIQINTLKMAAEMLDRREKIEALLSLVVVVVSAVLSAMMVASIAPFIAIMMNFERAMSLSAVKWIYDLSGISGKNEFVTFFGLLVVFLIVVASLVQIVRVYAITRFVSMRAHSIGQKLLRKYLARSYSHYLSHSANEMGNMLLSETQQVIQQFFKPLAEVVAAGFAIGAILMVMLYVDFKVSLILFSILGGIYGVALVLSKRRLKRLGVQRGKANSARFKVVNEGLSGFKELKLYGKEKFYLGKYEQPSKELAATQVKVAIISQIPQYLMHAIVYLSLILVGLVAYNGYYGFDKEKIEGLIPTFALLMFAIQKLMPELAKFFQNISILSYGSAAVERVYKDLSFKEEGGERSFKEGQAIFVKESLEVKDVSFSYENSEKPSLLEVNLSFSVGDRIGIVGETGSGKTTLINILLGLLMPSSGSVLVDGSEITKSNLRDWRASIGYVPQEIFLTDSTILENIAFGVDIENIDQDKVIQAAKMARIYEFVTDSLPDGFNTQVGERGIRLSGGQRQRIGLARAFYRNLNVIVLDEATSALDNVTEASVLDSIESLPKDTLLLIVAHRLSTIKNCTKIVVLDKGEISSIGDWDFLIQRSEIFRNLVNRGGVQ